MLSIKNREGYENIYWNMPQHSLGNKFNIMIANGRGAEWPSVGGRFVVKMFILLHSEPREYITFKKFKLKNQLYNFSFK